MSFPGMEDHGPEVVGGGRRLVWTSGGAVVTAANSSQIGGGIMVAPQASIVDGIMNLLLIGDVKRRGAAHLFPKMLAGGRHVTSPHVRIISCKSVVIEPQDRSNHIPAVFADGEYLGTLPLRAELRAGALKVLKPPVDATVSGGHVDASVHVDVPAAGKED